MNLVRQRCLEISPCVWQCSYIKHTLIYLTCNSAILWSVFSTTNTTSSLSFCRTLNKIKNQNQIKIPPTHTGNLYICWRVIWSLCCSVLRLIIKINTFPMYIIFYTLFKNVILSFNIKTYLALFT